MGMNQKLGLQKRSGVPVFQGSDQLRWWKAFSQ
jgi:hypothetical protein